MYKLSQYPILHRFLAHLYKTCNIYSENEKIFKYIKDDIVKDYCRCGDKQCATLYLSSERVPVFSNGEDEYIEVYNSNKGLIVLHFYHNGDIDVEALEYDNYPFKEELSLVYNGKDHPCANQEVASIVNEYFESPQIQLEEIVIN